MMKVRSIVIFLFISTSLLFARERKNQKQITDYPDEIFRTEAVEQINEAAEIPTKLVSIELIKNSQTELSPHRFIYKGIVDDDIAPYVKDPVAFQDLVNGDSYSSISPDDAGQFYVSNTRDTTLYNMLRHQNNAVRSTTYEMIFGEDNFGLAFKTGPNGYWITQVPFRFYDTNGTPANYDDDMEMLVLLYPPANAWPDTVSWGIHDTDDCPWTYNPAYESDWIYVINFKEEMTYDDLVIAYNGQQSAGVPANNLMEFYDSEVIARTTINSIKNNPLTTVNEINGLPKLPKGTTIRWTFELGVHFTSSSMLYSYIGNEMIYVPEVFSDPKDPATISLLSGPTGMYMDTQGNINWQPGYEHYGMNEFVLQAQNNLGIIERVFLIWVDRVPREMRDHVTGRVKFSIANTSVIGQEYYSEDDVRGQGFQYKGENGLYAGSLVISNGVNTVVGANLYEIEDRSDYAPQGPVEEIEPLISGFDQNYKSEYTDERSATPLGLHIVQRSYSNSLDNNHNGYVILDYDIINQNDSTLHSVYVGLFTDWDVGGYANDNSYQNLSVYEDVRKLLYSYNTNGATNTHFASQVLVGEVSGAHDAAGPDANYLLDRMKNGVDLGTEPSEIHNLLSSGPYTIEAGKSVRVVFAVLGGANLTDLEGYADAARNVQLFGNNVTFRVDMSPVIEQGIFDPGNGDLVVIRGFFNNWTGIDDRMADTDSNGIYEYMRTMTETAGTDVEYKFAISKSGGGDIWEDHADFDTPPNYNRVFHFGGRNMSLPVVYFDNNNGSNPFMDKLSGDLTNDSSGSTSVCWADFNEDGLEDVIIGNDKNNTFFLQTSANKFIKQTTSVLNTAGDYTYSIAAGDYNNDGHLDLFIADHETPKLFMGAGDGTFSQETGQPVTSVIGSFRAATWVDANMDGWLDLYICNSWEENNFYFQNNGDGSFTRNTDNPIANNGGSSFDCAWSDFDNDGDPDLFVANGFGQNNFYYRNDGNGNFSLKTTGTEVSNGGYASACAAGDFDNDGDFDLLVTNYAGPNWLFENDGLANFNLRTDIYLGSDNGARNCGFIDFNNDGWLDIFIGNADNFNQLFRNNMGGGFHEIPYGPFRINKFKNNATAWTDFQHDGTLDLFAANWGARNTFSVNNNDLNNWLQIETPGENNGRYSIGARVEIKATLGGIPRTQTRQIAATSGRSGQSSLVAAFGLGQAANVDSIRIWWPSGAFWDTTNVAANQRLGIAEPGLVVPDVQTLAATSIDQQGANLNGQVNTNGIKTTIRFLYGETTEYSDSVLAEQSPLTSTKMTGVWFDLNGLNSSQTYHYKVVVINSLGRFEGEDVSFNTLASANLPVLQIEPAKDVSVTTAGVSGVINPNGSPTSVILIYGETTPSLTAFTDNSHLSGSSSEPIEGFFRGLTPNTAYVFQMVATNDAGSDSSELSHFTTLSYPENVNVNTIVSYPNRSDPSEFVSSDYRLIGLPTKLNRDIGETLGGEQRKDWQLYWDNGASSNFFIIYTGQFRFKLGQAYWLIHDGPLLLDLGNVPNAPLNYLDRVLIDLHSGWNLITNPYTEDIDWTVVKETNSIYSTLYRYENGFSPSDKFSPYLGYYIFNTDDLDSLIIPYLPSAGSKKLARSTELNWMINIDLQNSTGGYSNLYFGASDDADEKIDKYDQRMPRGPEDMVSAYFDRPDWDEDYPAFFSDVRPPAEAIQEWPFKVDAKRASEIEINFSGLEDVDAGKEIYLADLVNIRSQNLREASGYKFTAVKSSSDFRVLIGSQDEIDDVLSKLLPVQFAVGQNFPNPFNPETVIPVDIPERDHIIVSVYNILGQKIADLFNGEVDTGRHFYLWQGRDRLGQKLPSGLYFYHVQSQTGQTFTGKMMLIK